MLLTFVFFFEKNCPFTEFLPVVGNVHQKFSRIFKKHACEMVIFGENPRKISCANSSLACRAAHRRCRPGRDWPPPAVWPPHRSWGLAPPAVRRCHRGTNPSHLAHQMLLIVVLQSDLYCTHTEMEVTEIILAKVSRLCQQWPPHRSWGRAPPAVPRCHRGTNPSHLGHQLLPIIVKRLLRPPLISLIYLGYLEKKWTGFAPTPRIFASWFSVAENKQKKSGRCTQ